MGMLDSFKNKTAVAEIQIDDISPSPFQSRRDFSGEELSSLASSIFENGLIQPVIVRKIADGYELVAGERRLRACLLLGKKTIPAIIKDLDDENSAVWTITENLQRSNLGVFEEAEGIEALLSIWKTDRAEAAKRLGIAPCTLSNKLRILQLTKKTREIITKNNLTERHARELLRLPEEKREGAASHIAEKMLNVPETEKYISELLSQKPAEKKNTVFLIRDMRIFINSFEHAVKTMKSAGINAVSTLSENGDELIYSVRIPKSGVCRNGQATAPCRTAPLRSCGTSVI